MKRVALLSAALLLSVTASFGSGVLVEAETVSYTHLTLPTIQSV